jgi:hypothetical protein
MTKLWLAAAAGACVVGNWIGLSSSSIVVAVLLPPGGLTYFESQGA